jgi:hypothetical protein
MRYTLLQDGQPLDGLALLPDLAMAKKHGERVAADAPNSEITIEGYPEKDEALRTLAPMPTWRFDREINSWVCSP